MEITGPEGSRLERTLETKLTVSGLRNGVEYSFEVYSISDAGRSIAAGPVFATPTTGMEGVVAGLIVEFAEGAALGDDENSVPGEENVTMVDLTVSEQVTDKAVLVELSEPVDLATAEQLARDLANDDAVEWAEPDQFFFTAQDSNSDLAQPVSIPTDSDYSTRQWNLWDEYGISIGNGAADMTDAWAQSRGNGVRVAVIDTGITTHPDLDGQLVPGYDFVSNPEKLAAQRAVDGPPVAFDGDYVDEAAFGGLGRDPDPTDPGDWRGVSPVRDSSWHGTKIAGLIAAQANNAGITGVAPEATIQPIRALSWRGGLLSDIAASITWASGGTVDGAPANATPSKVINMSFAVETMCPVALQEAIDGAVARGSVLVAAAGNAADDAAKFAPANCNGVITVAATNRDGNRAAYSNYGSTIDIAAPGGDNSNPIITTSNSGTSGSGEAITAGHQGTSLAAAHVSAAAALLISRGSYATPSDVFSALTGHDFTRAFANDVCDPNQPEQTCGAGIITLAQTASSGCTFHQAPSSSASFGYAWFNLSSSCRYSVPAGAKDVTVLAVGGGGGGGGPNPGTSPGGGGGGGDVVTRWISGAPTLDITVGTGGRGGTGVGDPGQDGFSSTVSWGGGQLVARGGGGGGSPGSNVHDGRPGASGGGAAGSDARNTFGGAPLNASRGNYGGANERCGKRPSGGGGGSWNAGQRGSCAASKSGDGGDGRPLWIWKGQELRFGAGGGGGGNYRSGNNIQAGNGGAGGGGGGGRGAGWNGSSYTAAQNGANFYGAGGGGGGNSQAGALAGGSGGRGAVILRWTKGDQTITFPTPTNKLLNGGAFQVSATSTSGLPVSLRSLIPVNCTISGFTVTPHRAGDCILSATQPGNISFQNAPGVTRTFQITKASQSITFPAIANRTLAQNRSFSVNPTASSGLNVSLASQTQGVCTVSAKTITVVTAGTCRVTATQNGNDTWASQSVSRQFTVSKATVNYTWPLRDQGPITATYQGSLLNLRAAGSAPSSSGVNGSTQFTSGDDSIARVTPTGFLYFAGVGTTTLTATFTPSDSTTYQTASLTMTVNVQRRPITVTASSSTVTADQNWQQSFTISSGNLGDGDAISAVTFTYTGGSYTSTTKPTDPGTYTVTPSAAVFSSGSAANYAITYQSGNLVVDDRNPQLSWQPISTSYGAPSFTLTPPAAQLGGSPVPGTFSYASTDPTVLSISGDAATVGGVGSTTVTATFTPEDPSSYNSVSITTNVTVSRTTGATTWSLADRTYAGREALPTPVFTYRGSTIPGTISYRVSGTAVNVLSGAPTIVAAGTASITATFTPSDTGNYRPVTATRSITVNKIPVTLTMTNFSVAYGTPYSPSATVTGTVAPGDAYSLSFFYFSLSPLYADSNPPFEMGDYDVYPTLDFTSGSASNYDITYDLPNLDSYASFSIVRATPTIDNWTNVTGTLSTASLSTPRARALGVAIPGSFTFTSTNTNVVSVGPNNDSPDIVGIGSASVTASFTPDNTSIFGSGVSRTITVTVDKDVPTLTWQSTTREYGSDIPLPVATIAGESLAGSFSYTSSNEQVVRVNGTSLVTEGVGTSTLTATFSPTDTANYQSGITTQMTLTVTPRSIRVSAEDITVTAGDAFTPTFTVSRATGSALVGTDSISSLSFEYDGNSTKPTQVGTYTITPSAAIFGSGNASNYTVTYVPGTLSIDAAARTPQTITFASLMDKELGDQPFSISSEATTDATGLDVEFSTSSAGVCSITGSTVTIDGTGLCTIRATQSGNATYQPAAPVERSFRIRAVPSMSWSAINKTYGDTAFTLPMPTITDPTNQLPIPGTISFSTGNAAVVTLSRTQATIRSAGTVTLSASFTPLDTATYASTSVTTTVTVAKATPTISWSNVTGVFESVSIPWPVSSVPGSFSYSSDDADVVDIISGQPTIIGAGSATVTANFTPTDANRYSSVTGTSIQVTVNKITPAITWAGVTGSYGNATISQPTVRKPGTNTTVDGTFTYITDNANMLDVTQDPPAVVGVGTATVTATFTPSSANSAIYASAQSQTITVTTFKASPTINWNAGSDLTGTFGQLSVPPATVSGVFGSFTYESSATGVVDASQDPPAVVGAGSATLVATFTPTDLDLYAPSSTNLNVTVERAVPTITWSDVTGVFGQTSISSPTPSTPGSFTFNTADPQVIDVTQDPPAIIAAGSTTITTTFTPTATQNFTTVTSTINVTISEATPAVTWSDLNATFGAASLSRPTTSVAGTFSYATNNANVVDVTQDPPAVIGAGNATVTATFTPRQRNRYATVTLPAINLSIAKRPLTIRADDQTIDSGTDPANEFTVQSGTLASGDALESLTFTYSDGQTTTSTVPTLPGTYAIIPTAATFVSGLATNYDLTFAPGQLIVQPVTAQMDWQSMEVVYGEELAIPEPVVRGPRGRVVGNFDFSRNGNKVQLSGSRVIGREVGTAQVTANFTPADSRPGWQFNSATSTVTVVERPLIVTTRQQTVIEGRPIQPALSLAGDTSFAFDDGVASVTYTYEGAGSTNYGPSTTPPSEPGLYTVTPSVSLGAGLGAQSTSFFATASLTSVDDNYEVSYQPGELVIEAELRRISQTITFDAIEDQPLSAGNITVNPVSDSGLPVTLETGTPGVCTITGFTINFVAEGQCLVGAIQTGNQLIAPAEDVAHAFRILGPQPAVRTQDPGLEASNSGDVVDPPSSILDGTSGAAVIDQGRLVPTKVSADVGQGRLMITSEGFAGAFQSRINGSSPLPLPKNGRFQALRNGTLTLEAQGFATATQVQTSLVSAVTGRTTNSGVRTIPLGGFSVDAAGHFTGHLDIPALAGLGNAAVQLIGTTPQGHTRAVFVSVEILRPQTLSSPAVSQRAGFFEPRSAELSKRGKAKLQALVDGLPNSARGLRFIVTGASLGLTGNDANNRLAKQRSATLRSALQGFGLAAETFTINVAKRSNRSLPHTLSNKSGKPLSTVTVTYRTLTG